MNWPPRNRLAWSLLANAMLSAVSGTLILALTPQLATFLRTLPPGMLRVFAVALLVHAVILYWVHSDSTQRKWTTINLVCIGPYPTVLLALVAARTIPPGPATLLVLADALAVSALIVWQLYALHSCKYAGDESNENL